MSSSFELLSDFFAQCSKKTNDLLAQILHERFFDENEPIFFASEPCVVMYFIASGSVILQDDLGQNVLNAQQFFGQELFLKQNKTIEQAKRQSNATALAPCKLLAISIYDFLQIPNTAQTEFLNALKARL